MLLGGWEGTEGGGGGWKDVIVHTVDLESVGPWVQISTFHLLSPRQGSSLLCALVFSSVKADTKDRYKD